MAPRAPQEAAILLAPHALTPLEARGAAPAPLGAAARAAAPAEAAPLLRGRNPSPLCLPRGTVYK